METYRFELFRAAVVNQNYGTRHGYAKKHGFTDSSVARVWNGYSGITVRKLREVIAPLGLTLDQIFTPETETTV